jgi:hypothetical protein
MENSKSPEELVEILDDFFADKNFLAEELEIIIDECINGEKVESKDGTEKRRVKSEEAVIVGFEQLIDYWESTPKGSELGRKIEQNIREYLEICSDRIELLLKFSKQVNIGTLPEELIGEVLEDQLLNQDDIFKLEEYRQKVLLGSGIEIIILSRQRSILEENKGLIEAIKIGNVENIPAWFVRMLEFPKAIPSDLKLTFITKARQIRRTLKTPKDKAAKGLFAQEDEPLDAILEKTKKTVDNLSKEEPSKAIPEKSEKVVDYSAQCE